MSSILTGCSCREADEHRQDAAKKKGCIRIRTEDRQDPRSA